MTGHPFRWIKGNSRKKVFVFFLICSIITMLIFQALDVPLKTEAAPFGIVSFQFAGSSEKALEILGSWDLEATQYALFGLGFDYIFMIFYVFTIGLGCAMVSQKFYPEKKKIAFVGFFLSWGQIVAGLADALENYALTLIILKDALNNWPEIAFIAAVVKFFFIIAGIIYLIAGALIPAGKRNL